MSTPTISVPYSGNVHRVVLENGLTLLAFYNPAVRSVNIMGSLLAGSIYERPDERMAASVTASMLMRGTIRRDFDTLAETLEGVGADLSVAAGVLRVGYGSKSLAEDFTLMLELINEVLRTPTFPAEHLALVQQQMVTQFQFALNDTQFRASRTLRETLYPAGHPFQQALAGRLEAVKALTPEVLHTYHQRAYSPQGMTMIVVGAVDPLVVEAEVRAVLGDWQGATVAVPTIPFVAAPTEVIRLTTVIPGKTQSDIMMGVPGPSRFSEDYLKASLANSVLGEFGMMGRLGYSIREQGGLAYYASSSVEASDAQGVWSISAGVADKNIELAIEKARAEVRRLTDEPISADELADNQSYYVGRLPLRLESSGGIGNMLETMERYGLGLDYLRHYDELIYSITREDIQQIAQRYLNADGLYISVAGSADQSTVTHLTG